MKPVEVNSLLELIGEFYPVNITPEKVRAWSMVLGKVEFGPAKQALIQCLQELERQPRPADIIRRIPKEIFYETVSKEESEFLGDIYRKQRERNAAQRGTTR
ncbi:hypothetical protein D3C87_1531360 [compost metagenome]